MKSSLFAPILTLSIISLTGCVKLDAHKQVTMFYEAKSCTQLVSSYDQLNKNVRIKLKKYFSNKGITSVSAEIDSLPNVASVLLVKVDDEYNETRKQDVINLNRLIQALFTNKCDPYKSVYADKENNGHFGALYSNYRYKYAL